MLLATLGNMNAGRRVKKRRIELGFSQSAIAHQAGVDRDTYRALERDERWPQDKNRAKIERALDWAPGSLEQIRDGGDPIPLPAKIPDGLFPYAIEEQLDHARQQQQTRDGALKAISDLGKQGQSAASIRPDAQQQRQVTPLPGWLGKLEAEMNEVNALDSKGRPLVDMMRRAVLADDIETDQLTALEAEEAAFDSLRESMRMIDDLPAPVQKIVLERALESLGMLGDLMSTEGLYRLARYGFQILDEEDEAWARKDQGSEHSSQCDADTPDLAHAPQSTQQAAAIPGAPENRNAQPMPGGKRNLGKQNVFTPERSNEDDDRLSNDDDDGTVLDWDDSIPHAADHSIDEGQAREERSEDPID